MCCVADGGASGAGTEEGTSFRDTSRVAISLPDHPLRMCDVMNRNGQRVYCPLLAALTSASNASSANGLAIKASARITASCRPDAASVA